jgi:hypothetical protein
MRRIGHSAPWQSEAVRLREQAEEFDRLAQEARDKFIREKFSELARLYRQPAEMAERTGRPPADQAAK